MDILFGIFAFFIFFILISQHDLQWQRPHAGGGDVQATVDRLASLALNNSHHTSNNGEEEDRGGSEVEMLKRALADTRTELEETKRILEVKVRYIY